jgi:hypothetical protein
MSMLKFSFVYNGRESKAEAKEEKREEIVLQARFFFLFILVINSTIQKERGERERSEGRDLISCRHLICLFLVPKLVLFQTNLCTCGGREEKTANRTGDPRSDESLLLGSLGSRGVWAQAG